MDELFDFSSLGFGEDFGLDSGGEDFSGIAEQLAKFAFAQSTGSGSSQAVPRQLAHVFARQLFAGRNAPTDIGGYFGLSSGQSMARLASMIMRANRRFL
jgi:hypothetical protein